MPYSTIGGSIVLSAANIHAIARPGVRIARQQPRMALRDVEDDRPRLEQGEIAFLIGRNLPKRMQLKMRGLLHLAE
jgi:hypothetical protein